MQYNKPDHHPYIQTFLRNGPFGSKEQEKKKRKAPKNRKKEAEFGSTAP
jgi:hypothetical protein